MERGIHLSLGYSKRFRHTGSNRLVVTPGALGNLFVSTIFVARFDVRLQKWNTVSFLNSFLHGVAAKGGNPFKHAANLFPVTALDSESDLVSSPAQLVSMFKEEFERRWHAMPDDLEPSFTSCDVLVFRFGR